ncbi:MAG: allantoicase [Gemmatimonadota bacterium]
MAAHRPDLPAARRPDLAAERVGGRALYASDEFFAPKERLLKPGRGVWIEDRYTDRGKWMDGWETRRRREPGYDWVIVRLGLPGTVRSVIVDTNHFRGNAPASASVDACEARDDARATLDRAAWRTIVPETPLEPHTENLLVAVDDARRVTHVRLTIHPDGGVARFRVLGEVAPDWSRIAPSGQPIDLAALAQGGVIVAASDEFFSAPLNLLMPGDGVGMHDGWETRRRRGPGNDWVVVRLGRRGRLRQAVIDTRWFKGNNPGAASVDAADAAREASVESLQWQTALERVILGPDEVHVFALELVTATHVRLQIYPDGGVSRLRILGEPAS